MNPEENHQVAYDLSRKVLDFLISQMKPGKSFKSIYASAQDFVQKVRPDFGQMFVRSVGYHTGLETHSTGAQINASNEDQVESDSTFIVSAGFDASEMDESRRQQPWATWFAETVFVPADGSAQILTWNKCSQIEHIHECLVANLAHVTPFSGW